MRGFLLNSVMLLAVIGVLTVVCDVWRKDFCLFLKCWAKLPFPNHFSTSPFRKGFTHFVLHLRDLEFLVNYLINPPLQINSGFSWRVNMRANG